MILPPAVQVHVAQIIQLLGMQAMPLESLEIHLDRDKVAQSIKPQLNFRPMKTDKPCGG